MTLPTVRVKVTLQLETKAALELAAACRGVSLSELLASAAEEKHLLRRQRESLEAVLDYLVRINAMCN